MKTRILIPILGILSVAYLIAIPIGRFIPDSRGMVTIKANLFLYYFMGSFILAILSKALERKNILPVLGGSAVFIILLFIIERLNNWKLEISFTTWLLLTILSVVCFILWLIQLVKRDRSEKHR